MNFRIIATALVCAAVATPALAQGSHMVRGHYRKDGTYVAPHMQTNQNKTRLDNWSTRGNVNPYTGKVGTKDPYSSPSDVYSRPRSSSADADGGDD